MNCLSLDYAHFILEHIFEVRDSNFMGRYSSFGAIMPVSYIIIECCSKHAKGWEILNAMLILHLSEFEEQFL